jgi:hypothetical protein
MGMLIMAIVNRISEQEYRELALSDSDRLWELWDGVPREKPLMSMSTRTWRPILGRHSSPSSIDDGIV